MNILVYYPISNYKRVDIRWIYGIDIIELLEKQHPEWCFVYVDGSQDNIYDNIDVLLRLNRHDGYAKMIVEADLLKIPYIWSYESGRYREPKFKEIEKRLYDIQKNIHEKVYK